MQSLKYELHDVSTAALFLLARAWLSPSLIGIPFYWAMVVEAECEGPHQIRYKALRDEYLTYCRSVTDVCPTQYAHLCVIVSFVCACVPGCLPCAARANARS